MLGQALTLATLLAISLTRNYSPNSLDEGFAGIALTYLSGLTFALNGLNISTAETESRMNSVERVKEYDSLPQESESIIPENRPPKGNLLFNHTINSKGWPSKGEIEFKNYSLSYRKDEKVLNDISVKFEDKDKVGIVGRTGAGW